MSPKSLLRHKECVSHARDFTSGRFEEILEDSPDYDKARRLLLCSGKVYYDLKAHREKNNLKHTAIIRIEQLYPLHSDKLKKVIEKYSAARKVLWCQEEPMNMGAWTFIAPRIQEITGKEPLYAGREESASPAVGSLPLHKIELEKFLESAFSL